MKCICGFIMPDRQTVEGIIMEESVDPRDWDVIRFNNKRYRVVKVTCEYDFSTKTKTYSLKLQH